MHYLNDNLISIKHTTVKIGYKKNYGSWNILNIEVSNQRINTI